MNKIFAMCGMVLLGTTATPNNQETTNEFHPIFHTVATNTQTPLEDDNCITCKGAKILDLDSIVYLEEESPFELGFNTADYLPEGFNPNEVYVDLDAITFIEGEEEISMGFDTSDWLPDGFDPYAAPTDIYGFSFMEEDDSLLAPIVDTKAYLPENFDPYAPYVDSEEIDAATRGLQSR